MSNKHNIPRTMSTQHPDNVTQPFFVGNPVIAGDDEIKEAYYAFSHLGAKEQLWDCEGKETDNFVIEKLLTRYPEYFNENKLGESCRLTLRGPNPSVEKNQGKILLETLQSIPRNFDIAKRYYNEDLAPIFEIAIPMTSSSQEIARVKNYYNEYITGIKDKQVHDVSISKWLGDFKPDTINVIPLIETKDSMLKAAQIIKEYIQGLKEELEYQRVWLARSDPALNYGCASAVLINKVSLQRLHHMEEELSIQLYPMIGCGAAPFRGNFRPDKVENCMKAYPSVQTHTLQSAYKYDFDEKVVRDSIEKLENTSRSAPTQIDEEQAEAIIEKISASYQKHITHLAPMINKVASLVPKRRKRKLHIGLFGYSRKSGSVSLPRAITFTAALYSMGLPPEILGLDALSEKELEFLYENSKGFENDMADALQYFNPQSLNLLHDQDGTKKLISEFNVPTHDKHQELTTQILENVKKNNLLSTQDHVENAARIRKFLG